MVKDMIKLSNVIICSTDNLYSDLVTLGKVENRVVVICDGYCCWHLGNVNSERKRRTQK